MHALLNKKPSKTQLMGILNVTPDSFYDQGQWFALDLAVQRALRISQEGADIIDIGGESTRPGAAFVDEAEELRRVIPLIKAIKSCGITTPLSIDTSKPAVAQAAIAHGATFLNDILGFRHLSMRKIAAEAALPICVMHCYETPATMQNNPYYPQGVVPFLLDWFVKQIELLLETGVLSENIILDPGIGFGKTVEDNLQILQNIPKFKALGFPLLLGVSRKSFLGKIVQKPATELLNATLAMNGMAVLNGVEIIRVHDIMAHRDLIDVLTYRSNKM